MLTTDAISTAHGDILWEGDTSYDTRVIMTADGNVLEFVNAHRTTYTALANKWYVCRTHFDADRNRLYIDGGAYVYGWRRPYSIARQERIEAHRARMTSIWG